MKKVILYELTQREMQSVSDHLQFYSYDQLQFLPSLGKPEACVPIDNSIKIESIPIHHIRKFSRIPIFNKEDKCFDHIDYYIAIHPDVREILECAIKQEYDVKIYDLDRKLSDMKFKINRFHSNSWYKRIWSAIKNKL